MYDFLSLKKRKSIQIGFLYKFEISGAYIDLFKNMYISLGS